MFNKKRYEFTPLFYIGLVIGLIGLAFPTINDHPNPWIDLGGPALIIFGLYLVHKGRKERLR